MSATASNKKVHVINGGSKYLQVKSGNKIAFWATDTSNTYTWLVMPALADETDTTMFSLRSVDDEDKWLVIDTEIDYSSSTAPAGGWTKGTNDTYVMILTSKPTDSDGNKKASFKITTAADSSLTGYSSYLLVYDETKYLRDYWNIAQCGSAQTGDDAKYSSAKFIDVTE